MASQIVRKDTVAEMLATSSLVDKDEVSVLGYYAIGDDGNGNWRISSSGTVNSVTILSMSNGLKAHYIPPLNYFNMRSLGFKSDGSDNSSKMSSLLSVVTDGTIYCPIGKFKFNSTITIPKQSKVTLLGEKSNRGTFDGSQFDFSLTNGSNDDKIGIKIGVADGNPDSTNFASDVIIKNLSITTEDETGYRAVDITNTRFYLIDSCSMHKWKSRLISSNGGNIIGRVNNCELFGPSTTATGVHGIYHGSYQFGNFDIRYDNNHFAGVSTIAKVGEGRDFRFTNCTIDGANTNGFDMGGVRAVNVYIDNNYFENVRGRFFNQESNPSNSINNLTFRNNDIWPSGPVNTEFGNLSRVNNYDSSCSFIPTIALKNAQPELALANVYDDANPFDGSRTVRYASGNRQYENDLTEALLLNELIGGDGLFGALDGSGSSARPEGWLKKQAGTWSVQDTPIGRCTRFTTSGVYRVCAKDISFLPLDNSIAPRLAIGYTARNWVAIDIYAGSTKITPFDQPANDWKTVAAVAQLPQGTTSITVEIKTNATTIDIAELKIWQVSSIDAINSNGKLEGAIQRAVLKNLTRGIYDATF